VTVYAYTARSARGEALKGNMEADSPESVAARLMQGGTIPINIVEAVGSGSGSNGAQVNDLAMRLGLGKPSTADLVLLTRQLYTITKSGIPLLRGLRSLSSSTHNPVLRRAMEDIVVSLEGGSDLATSFGRCSHIFSQLYIGLVAVGEATGTLEKSFLSLGQYLAQEQDIQDRVKGAIRYPAIVMLVIAGAMVVLTMFVIPKFAPLFKVLGDKIPWPTKIIMETSEFVQHYWQMGLAVAVVLAIIASRILKTDEGRGLWHKVKLRIPVIGTLLHQAILARVMRTLSISLTAGVPMLQTLSTIERSTGNDYITERIRKLRETVERGEPLARAATNVGMFPPLVLQMIAVGEETGGLPELLDEVAGFYEREVDYTVKSLAASFEPILIVCVGAMVLVLALGVFLPMWDMIAKVGGGGH
jgi:MSHA biogenesis protein MshG